MLPNIYFSGRAGSGKSFCCQYIKDKYGSLQAKFANPVYMIAEKYFGMTQKDRFLLQTIGTEIGRNTIDKSIWVNQLIRDLEIVKGTSKLLYNKDVSFVSDDTRFMGEHEVLKKAGWVGIWLLVTDEERKRRLIGRDGTAQEETLNHSSETEMLQFKDDLIQLDANGTLDETYTNLEVILNSLRTEVNQ